MAWGRLDPPKEKVDMRKKINTLLETQFNADMLP